MGVLLWLQDETGAPGLVVGVSVDGKQVWAEGTVIPQYYTRSN